jgi:DNA-binding LytR/AlgR family response regulator
MRIFVDVILNNNSMGKIKVLLVEDLSYVEIALKERLNDLGFDVVGILPQPELVKGFLESNKADIVITDLFISKSYSGIKMANEVMQKYNIPVILVNGEDNIESSVLKNASAYAMFIKPLKDIDLAYTINAACLVDIDAETKQKTTNDKSKLYIFVRADYRLNKIRVSDIYYLEAKKDYVTIHTSDNVYTVHATMKEMERILPSELFIRTHRSYIVNLDKIFSIKYPDILIEHKMKTIQIGGLYRKELFNKINVV